MTLFTSVTPGGRRLSPILALRVSSAVGVGPAKDGAVVLTFPKTQLLADLTFSLLSVCSLSLPP